MTAIQTLTPMLNTLPQDAQWEVVDFVSFLLEKAKKHMATRQSQDSFYSTANQNRLRQSIAQFAQGKVVVKTMAELEAMERE
jgi:hypothetical protein